MRLDRLLIARACAALLVAAPLPATQARIFDDNELRANLIIISEEAVDVEERMKLIEHQIVRLRSETVQLSNLIDELRAALSASQAKATKREAQISDLVARANATLEKHDARSVRASGLLRNILEGLDGKEYSAALYAYGQAGDVTGALETLEGIIKFGNPSPYAGSARYWIGKINYQQGEHDAARPDLEKFIEEHPADHRVPDAMLMLTLIAQLQGDPESPRMEDDILRLHPTSAAADQIRSLRP